MDEDKLEKLYDMVRENNSMLKSQRRAAFVGSIVKVVWWVAILIVFPYLTWLYIQPYLNTLTDQYTTAQQKGAQLQNQAQDLQKQIGGFTDLLKEFGIGGQ